MPAGRAISQGNRSISPSLRAIVARLLDLVFPWSCIACGAERGALFCAQCLPGIPWLGAVCPRCGLPGPGLCSRCGVSPPDFARCRALAVYQTGRSLPPDPLGLALRALKYARRRALAGPLGALLADRYPYAAGEHDVVVPVPLHVARLRERGFNQALLLARAPARASGSPLIPDAIRRARATPSQAMLDERTRRRNLRDAFHVARPDRIAGLRVLLIDDVVTTGATADACTRALLEAGARQVDVLSVARSLPPGLS